MGDVAGSDAPGPLALVGGGEWNDGCDFDAALLEGSGADEVVVLPTAAAFERPQAAVDHATAWFRTLGAHVRPCPILARADAELDTHAGMLRRARFIYLGGGSPMHLCGVMKGSAAWSAIVDAWRSGATLAASSAGAMVLGDPMIDPRGGAFTIGLALVPGLAVLPHADTWSPDRVRRTRRLAGRGVVLASIAERTALLRAADGSRSTAGAGAVSLYTDGGDAPLAALPALLARR